MNAVAGLLRGRSIILKITRARNSIKFSKIHSSRGLAAAWLRPARDHTSCRAARRFEGHDIGYFYPGLGANGILHQITRPSLRNLHQTFFRTTGIRREMNKTRYVYNLPRRRPPSSFSSLLVGFFPHHLMETIFTSFYSQHCYCEFSTRSLSRMWVSRWWDKCRYGRCFVSALADW